MIIFDGSNGEGGGQMLRTALALSMITKKPFKIKNIRQNRESPGLKAQHLAGINALCKISKSVCFGIEIGSKEVEFHPSKIEKYKTTIDVETAGPITLVFQTILPPLLFADKKSTIILIGGTDVNFSPSIDYFTNVVIPQLTRFADIKLKIEKRGYYPKGQGKIEIKIKPKYSINKFSNFKKFLKKIKEEQIFFNLTNQGKILFVKGVSHSSNDLTEAFVFERQKKAAMNILKKLNCPVMIRTECVSSESTGSGITIYAGFSNNDELNLKNPIILGSDELGEKGKRSEIVGENAAKRLIDEINSTACVDFHLADNLLPFMSICGGKIKTSKITDHILSNIYVIEKFLNIKFEVDEESKVISIKPNV